MITYVLEQIENVTDQQFMASLYESHKYIMFATAKKYMSDVNVCEDLVQDSLIKLIPKIDLLRRLERCKLTAYVVSTVRNTARNYLRETSTERKYLFFEDISEDIYRHCSDERQIEDMFISTEMSAVLRKVIAELPEKEQELFL